MRISDWSSDVCSSDLEHGQWRSRLSASSQGQEFLRRMERRLPEGFSLDGYLSDLIANPQKVATRKASELTLGAINDALPETIGGSADLTGSNNTKTKATRPLTPADDSRTEEHTSELQVPIRHS